MDSGFGINGASTSHAEMTSSRLDYWTPFILENGVKQSFDLELRPHSIAENGPYEFNFQGDNKKFIDLSSLRLFGQMRVKVLNDKGNWVSPKDVAKFPKDWGLVNNFYQSLFSSVVIKINDLEVGEKSTNAYAYMSYLQTLLGTSSSQAKNHIHAPSGFINRPYTATLNI